MQIVPIGMVGAGIFFLYLGIFGNVSSDTSILALIAGGILTAVGVVISIMMKDI